MAGDRLRPGGQLIGQEILEHLNFRGEVMRVMFTAQDPQTIRDAFARAKPNQDDAPLYAAAVARGFAAVGGPWLAVDVADANRVRHPHARQTDVQLSISDITSTGLAHAIQRLSAA